MISVQKQKDSSSCGLFAIVFATNILEGISAAESEFNATSMRSICWNVLRSNSFLLSRKIQNEHDVYY